MANLTFKLEEQLSDQRSNQIAYKLTIENRDSKPIRLLSVEPRVPIGVSVLQIRNTSLAEANARKSALIEELNQLLLAFLLVTSDTFLKTWIEKRKEANKEVSRGILTLFLDSRLNEDTRRRFESFVFKIASASDARAAYARWMDGANDQQVIRSLFEAKTEQLERVESHMDEGDRQGLTAIEPASFFTATYVLKFVRWMVAPRKYQVGFDATYQESDTSASQTVSTATNVQISPYPFSLSIIAIVGAVLGVLLRISLSGIENPLNEMLLLATSGQLLVGPVVALIFFNVYEYTSLGKGLGMSLSWRSALLIGALCGVAQDRVLAAMKALIGA